MDRDHGIDYSAATAPWTLGHEIDGIVGPDHEVVETTWSSGRAVVLVRDSDAFPITTKKKTTRCIHWFPDGKINWGYTLGSYHGVTTLPWSGRGIIVIDHYPAGDFDRIMLRRLTRSFTRWNRENVVSNRVKDPRDPRVPRVSDRSR